MTTDTKYKVHTVYKTKDGVKVPGATTVLKLRAKEALIHWAWKLGIEGKDYRKFRDDKASIGTLAHYLILCHLKKESPDVSGYTPQQVDQAENSLIKYWDWEKNHTIEVLAVEQPLVSDAWLFGGTPDLIAKVDDVSGITDFKSGKALYPEYWYQLAAYDTLVLDNIICVPEQYRLLRIGITEEEGFEEIVKTDLTKQWIAFKSLLNLYQIEKEIKKDGE